MLSTCEVGISVSISQVRALRLRQVRGGSGQDHTEQQQQKESQMPWRVGSNSWSEPCHRIVGPLLVNSPSSHHSIAFFISSSWNPSRPGVFLRHIPLLLLLFKAAGPGSKRGSKGRARPGSLHAEKSFLPLMTAEED